LKEQLSNGIMTIVVQAILSIVGLLATAAMTVVIQYLNKKKEEVSNKIGADNYNHIFNVAKATFFSVEQNFSGLTGMGEQKRKLFDSLLLQKMPGLTQQELDHFREGITGEMNHILKQSQLLAPIAPNTAAPIIAQPNTSSNAAPTSEVIEPKEIPEVTTPAEQTDITAA
jgi:hypothetical protein